MIGLLTLEARIITRDKPTTPGMYSRIFRNKGNWRGQTCHRQELLWVGYRSDRTVGLGFWVGDTWVKIAEDDSEWIQS